jgi:predicted nucleic acid binding AN1-type Zn finger protein
MKLVSSALLALSLFAAPVAFADHHEGDKTKKEGQTCNCAEGKCDGSCKHDKKDGHTCTGGESCKHHSHEKGAHKKEKKG